MEIDRSPAEELRDVASRDEQATATEIRLYKNLRTELAKYGLIIDDGIQKFVRGLTAKPRIFNLFFNPFVHVNTYSEKYDILQQLKQNNNTK